MLTEYKPCRVGIILVVVRAKGIKEDGDQVFLVQSLSCVQFFMTPWTTACQLLYPRLSPGVCSNSYLLNQWCCLIISSSVAPFFFCLQSFPATWSFPVSQLFASGGQSIGTSASVSVLPMNIQGWSPSWLTGLISLQPEGLSRGFSSTTIWKHQFFGTQPSLWSNSHIHIWLLKNHSFHSTDLCRQQRKALFYRIFSSCLLALNLPVTRPAHTLYRTAYGKPFDVPLPRTLASEFCWCTTLAFELLTFRAFAITLTFQMSLIQV